MERVVSNSSENQSFDTESKQDSASPKVLVIAPYFDKNVAGESWCTYKWVEGICKRCDATVLTTHTPNWDPAASPIQAAELVNWTHTKLKGKLARLDNELKPHYLKFYRLARRWIKERLAQGESFDLVHQVNPVALRYPSPAAGLGLPYILGPHAGSLPTPIGFRTEYSDKQWFRKIRSLDALRIRFDPWLRRSFSQASLVLGVAPYVEEFLSPIGIKRFEIMAETGPDQILDAPIEREELTDRPLRLIFVGRIIRTKGVIDAIRAVAIAAKSSNVTLEVIGIGDMLEACKAEATRLGVADKVNFHGRIPRSEVFEWYKRCDVFLFPSFREPSGTVVFEALGFGLPLITARNGGPGYVITDDCGFLVDPTTPEQYAKDLAKAIAHIDQNRADLPQLSAGALKRVREVADWEIRFEKLIGFYHETIGSPSSRATATR